MNKFDKLDYGITGIIGLIVGGSSLGLSNVDKLSGSKKILQIFGVLLTGIGMIFSRANTIRTLSRCSQRISFGLQ